MINDNGYPKKLLIIDHSSLIIYNSVRFLIIIPAHNEEDNLPCTLDSLQQQSCKDFKVVVVNDGSTDKTPEIIRKYTETDSRFETVNLQKSEHQPGSKVVHAFKNGLQTQSMAEFDIICKFDADIILPENYLTAVETAFAKNPEYGLVGGLLYIEKDGNWVYEGNSNKHHVRGPMKAYRKECFVQIGGLRETLGWDNIDSILLDNLGWKEVVLPELHVKLIKVKGADYTIRPADYYGRYFYFLGLNRFLAYIASSKEAMKSKSASFFFDIIKSYESCRSKKLELKITKEEQKAVNDQRWKMLKKKWLKM
ncbi:MULTISPECIES: glycosyltransferase family 2 protein [unclassified Chryseobacterium]|uniref:glycosyltransferase family 2 protein n=1 Tax=unclassified Chryseobacterium TaxID=2593645 RepID=UPI001B70A670|nr:MULTISPECIES: glycosyltransferase family 2 protein [unclassified Chryseobacterium]MBP1165436.1 glycosyltransferase involved in cell wall biosynthesis [Chryseobacterium sp. PvR013]MDR4894974.1 glycosyltransferase family 2 protein [Chryseobacterium sp. CFS7]